MSVTPDIRFIDMPEALREKYQYWTEARLDRLRGLGYNAAFASLEEGVVATVSTLIAQTGR